MQFTARFSSLSVFFIHFLYLQPEYKQSELYILHKEFCIIRMEYEIHIYDDYSLKNINLRILKNGYINLYRYTY